MKNILIGFVLITLITIVLWLAGKDLATIPSQPLRFTSQIAALLGIVYMGYSLVWSSQFKPVEKKVGGMDKMMKAHHGIGMIAFLLLMHHPLLLAIQALPLVEISKGYIIPGANLSYNLGIYSFYVLVFSLVCIIFVRLPYHIFKFLHQFMGLSFLLGGLHAMTIGSDIANNIYLKMWIVGWIIVGVSASSYIIFLHRFIGPKYNFFVSSVSRVGDIMHITLQSISRSFSYEPGQFCFVSFKQSDISAESHPFTISSPNFDDRQIRISAKILGDYTLGMTRIKKDTPTTVYGPYGGFGHHITQADEQIWIAGGIGITPFVSMIGKLKEYPTKNIWLIYIVRDEEQNLFLEEIPESIRGAEHIHFMPWFTKEKERPTAEKIFTQTGASKEANIYICGPQVLMDSLENQFIDMGIQKSHIFTESFSMT